MNIGKYELYRYIFPLISSNMYVIVSDSDALIIDPIEDKEACEHLDNAGIKTVTAVLTHEHFDHISGVNMLRGLMEERKGTCKVYANSYCAKAVRNADSNLSRFFKAMFITRPEEEQRIADEIFHMDYACIADVSFENDMTLKWEDLTLKLHSTPGHSPGSICIEIYDEDDKLAAVATGDSLVEGNSVITRLPKGSKLDYRNITRPYLETLTPDTLILPGHGEISVMRNLVLG